MARTRRRFKDLVPVVSASEYLFAVKRQVTELTLDVIEEFCIMIAGGDPITCACDYIGITDTLFQSWRLKGELVRKGDTGIKDGEKYEIFVMGMRRAGAVWIRDRVKKVQTSKHWYRELRLLMIRDPSNFTADPMGGSSDEYDPDESFL